MKLPFLLSLSMLFGLVACASVDGYIKTHKSRYLCSQDLGPLKIPENLKIGQTPYIIPAKKLAQPTQLPSLYPPTD